MTAPFHTWCLPDGSAWTHFFRLESGFRLEFPGLATFTLSSEGHLISVCPEAGVSQATQDLLYWHQVHPLGLSLQGHRVFHASAVALDNGAAAFMGRSGQGKSTLAMSFALNGCPFLTDDGLLLANNGADDWVQPSQPSVRLWDDSREALAPAHVQLGPAASHTPKARLLADGTHLHCDRPQRLRAIYVLGDGTSPHVAIEPLRPAEAVMALVQHSFLLDVETPAVIGRHFDALAELAQRPIFFRLDYPREYDRLAEVREAVTAHVHGLKHSRSP